jgi:hypothetical protein
MATQDVYRAIMESVGINDEQVALLQRVLELESDQERIHKVVISRIVSRPRQRRGDEVVRPPPEISVDVYLNRNFGSREETEEYLTSNLSLEHRHADRGLSGYKLKVGQVTLDFINTERYNKDLV